MTQPKLSIVIVCWNDKAVIIDAIRSVIEETKSTSYEILVSDNGSTDGSAELIEELFANEAVRVIRNGENLGFGRGNNAGFREAIGEYVLLLNPDTIVLNEALDKWMVDVENHPECGAFGTRLLYGDGSYQISARPFPTNRRIWQQVFGFGFLGLLSDAWNAGFYAGWAGTTDREIDWQSGACVMVRGDLLKQLKGLDPQFFYHFEEVDLCYRIRQMGLPIRFFAGAQITHLLGQTVKRDRSRFQIETLRNRLRYFAKHYGKKGAMNCRRATWLYYAVRVAALNIKGLLLSDEEAEIKAAMAYSSSRWLWHLDVQAFLENGVEPDLGFEPLVDHQQLVHAREEWA